MAKSARPVNFKRIKTSSLRGRKSLVSVEDFSKAISPSVPVSKWLAGLPNILGGKALRQLASSVIKARKMDKPVIIGFGAHLIKCGLSPIIIDFLKRGIVTALATHGASAVHDFELAAVGKTSEDVALTLPRGKFGMTRETGLALADAARRGARSRMGFGRALGELIEKRNLPHREISIFRSAYSLRVPITVHIAIGTDVFHFHPSLKGAELGESSLIDFRIFCSLVKKLSGGVYINVGSAVILPEVFLKAVSVAHNLGSHLKGLTTANLDMIQHYRPRVNVLERPSEKSFALYGQHEFLLPLLHAAIISRWEE